MIQEIITYVIIAIAVFITFLKFKKRFFKKKKLIKKGYKIDPSQHNCTDCAASCMLRDTINPDNRKEVEICQKTQTTN